MPSPLEIYFSAQQLCFSMEDRELCAGIESMPHEKYFVSHDFILSPIIISEDFDFIS
jgi:hypothetical protein